MAATNNSSSDNKKESSFTLFLAGFSFIAFGLFMICSSFAIHSEFLKIMGSIFSGLYLTALGVWIWYPAVEGSRSQRYMPSNLRWGLFFLSLSAMYFIEPKTWTDGYQMALAVGCGAAGIFNMIKMYPEFFRKVFSFITPVLIGIVWLIAGCVACVIIYLVYQGFVEMGKIPAAIIVGSIIIASAISKRPS